MEYELIFLKCLAETVVIETTVLILLFRLVFKRMNIRTARLLFAGFLASFATLPYLWFIFSALFDQRIWFVLVGESFAVLMESFIFLALLKISYPKALLVSFVCNAVSFSVGLVIN